MVKVPFLGFIILVILLVYLTIGSSLNFAINGDDWGALYRYIKDFINFNSYFQIENYSTAYSNYVFSHLLMGFIYNLFEFQPFPYYLASMILRVIAALSFYPAVYSATKNKAAAFFSSIFFATLYTGIETTNWVFNMNTYLAIALLNTTFYVLYKDKKVNLKKSLLLSLLMLFTFFASPTRMHGILLLIPIVSFIYIQNTKEKLKNLFFQSLLFYFPILFVRFLTKATSDRSYFESFSQILTNNQGAFTNLFASLGNAFLIDKYFIGIIPDFTLKALVTILFYLIMAICFYINRKKYKELSEFGLFSQTASILFLLIPWLINPTVILSSDQRYLILPGCFILMSIAVFCAIWWQKYPFKYFAIFLPLIIIMINFLTLKDYIATLADKGRNQFDSNKHMSYLLSQIKQPKNRAPIVFFFIPDDPLYLYNSITFGLPYHIILIDKRFTFDMQRAPFPVDNMDSLISVLSSPNSSELNRYGYNPIRIPLENVYTFKLENKQLTNISSETRELLQEKLKNQAH